MRPQEQKAVRAQRKVAAARAVRSRRIKQGISGAAFLGVLTAGWLYPLIGYFIPVCMLAGVGLAAWRGRSWCDWLCPRGSFSDALLAPVSRGRRIPTRLRGFPLRTGVLSLLLGVLTVQILRLWPDPWAIGGFFVLLLTLTTTVGVFLGVVWQQRSWCYICPIGTLSHWVGKKRQPLILEREKCVQCSLCAVRCPMQLSPMEAGSPQQGDCLKCGLCVASCPTAALSFEQGLTEAKAA